MINKNSHYIIIESKMIQVYNCISNQSSLKKAENKIFFYGKFISSQQNCNDIFLKIVVLSEASSLMNAVFSRS